MEQWNKLYWFESRKKAKEIRLKLGDDLARLLCKDVYFYEYNLRHRILPDVLRFKSKDFDEHLLVSMASSLINGKFGISIESLENKEDRLFGKIVNYVQSLDYLKDRQVVPINIFDKTNQVNSSYSVKSSPRLA